MKKAIVVLLSAAAVVMGVSCAFAGDSTPVKLSLIPGIAVPSQQTVHGLDFGLIASNVDEVKGLQLSWIFSGTKQEMLGVELGFVNISKNVTGIQWGFYNQAEMVTGLQLGFINNTVNMNGVQIGLVNIIKKGPLPFMVIANAKF